MKIIASQGTEAFLIEVDPDTHWCFDVEDNIVYKGVPLGSYLAHGNGAWKEWTPGPLDEGILKAVQEAREDSIEFGPKQETP